MQLVNYEHRVEQCPAIENGLPYIIWYKIVLFLTSSQTSTGNDF